MLERVRGRLGRERIRVLRWRDALWRPFLHGDAVWCAICGRGAKRFMPAGRPVRPRARCPWCGLAERHRMLWRYLDSAEPPRAVLHVAPEAALGERLRDRCSDYVSVDLTHDADVQADITVPLPFPDGRFDMVVCSHVLEHIPDDTGAVRQLTRVLSADGRLVVLVPISEDAPTVEEPLATPQERLAAYGQEDHVRLYGHDIVDRLRSCGLDVEVHRWSEVPEADARRLGIDVEAGDVYVCRPVPA